MLAHLQGGAHLGGKPAGSAGCCAALPGHAHRRTLRAVPTVQSTGTGSGGCQLSPVGVQEHSQFWLELQGDLRVHFGLFDPIFVSFWCMHLQQQKAEKESAERKNSDPSHLRCRLFVIEQDDRGISVCHTPILPLHAH